MRTPGHLTGWADMGPDAVESAPPVSRHEREAAPGPSGAPAVPGGSRAMPAGPERYAKVLDNLSEVVFETDREGRWTYLNAAWTAITGHPVADSLGRNFLDNVHPDEREATVQLFEEVVMGDDDHCHHETRYLTADGDYRWIELRASLLLDDDGEYLGNVGTILDITDRRRAQQLVADDARLLELIARGAPLETVFSDLTRGLADLTEQEIEVHAWAVFDLADNDAPPPSRLAVRAGPGQPAVCIDVPGDDGGRAQDDDRGDDADTMRLRIPAEGDGAGLGELVVRSAGTRWSPGPREQQVLDRSVQLAAIALQRAEAEGTALHNSLHDPLTGLPNRALVGDRLEQALARARRDGGGVALLLLDLDHFKIINDTFGHQTGDRVLQGVAERIKAALRASDTVGRLGGDEFAVVLPDVTGVSAAEDVAVHVERSLHAPLDEDGVRFHPRGSVGVAVDLDAQHRAADLLRFADVAMYRAKREGSGHAVYDPEWDWVQLRGFDLASQLREAIRDDQLVLHYQPKVSLGSGRVGGFEALVRWEHPEFGLIPPADFVPLAEMTGAVRPLLHWVIERALRDGRLLRADGYRGRISVNASAQSLHDPRLPAVVASLLSEFSDGAGRPGLEIEITENELMADPESARTAMDRLDRLGVDFSIDDFGTGYSSLSQLKQFAVRTLKIDMSFVRDMDRDERDASIVRTAVTLAHDLSMEVVAEGVERESVCEELARMGADCAQGYYFSRPVPIDEARRWLQQRADLLRP